ncbi:MULTISPECIES: hypothetical protein [unclassified Streptomyces]|uniref:hypothetical protein n=1 Tax=unclassified Streptomyces TaxID=2593676 RepID=UPI0004C675E4|nr:MULTISPECIES: hypothetical protein [unclassified Streptomyces]MCI3930176.1 hypothetical protein [Streptomyces sp. AN091965]
MDRYFWHLSSAQASGMACVVCGADLMSEGAAMAMVGRDPATETQVYACKDPCAVGVATEAERMAAELRAITGTDALSQDASLGQDGEFGALLREMRILVGNEALLAAITDIPTLLFLLELTEHHAGLAAARSRVIYDRMRSNEPGDGEA